jgi:undecaprenyl-diphosphatase
MAAGLISGTDRKTAADYSFLLSIPVILGASMVYPLTVLDFKEILTYNWLAIIVGTVISGITGYFCIKYFIKFIGKFSLSIFGYYCVIMGIIAYLFFINKV